MSKNILIDVGSSTVKVYSRKDSQFQMLESKSFHLKKNFDQATSSIAAKDKVELFEYLRLLSNKYSANKLDAYATGVFRKINQRQIKDIIEKCHELDIHFSILTDEQESNYLKLALIGRTNIDDEILLLNIGGATTELVVVRKGKDVEKHNIELGVGTVLSEFKEINTEIDQKYINEIKTKITNLLPELESCPKIAFFSGGELTFMQRSSYQLSQNKVLNDPLHPSVIRLAKFKDGNSKIYFDQTMSDLELLYPENPSWVHGARSCEIIAETIFEKYNIETIIPSDANLIDGIALKGAL